MNWLTKIAVQVVMRGWDSTYTMSVFIDGKPYDFEASRQEYEKVKWMVNKGLHGKAVQYLRKLPILSRSNPKS